MYKHWMVPVRCNTSLPSAISEGPLVTAFLYKDFLSVRIDLKCGFCFLVCVCFLSKSLCLDIQSRLDLNLSSSCLRVLRAGVCALTDPCISCILIESAIRFCQLRVEEHWRDRHREVHPPYSFYLSRVQTRSEAGFNLV